MSAARFAVEYRMRSRRTSSGWTKWRHYIVAESADDAQRIRFSLDSWCRENEGEVRVVDRSRDRGNA